MFIEEVVDTVWNEDRQPLGLEHDVLERRHRKFRFEVVLLDRLEVIDARMLEMIDVLNRPLVFLVLLEN